MSMCEHVHMCIGGLLHFRLHTMWGVLCLKVWGSVCAVCVCECLVCACVLCVSMWVCVHMFLRERYGERERVIEWEYGYALASACMWLQVCAAFGCSRPGIESMSQANSSPGAYLSWKYIQILVPPWLVLQRTHQDLTAHNTHTHTQTHAPQPASRCAASSALQREWWAWAHCTWLLSLCCCSRNRMASRRLCVYRRSLLAHLFLRCVALPQYWLQIINPQHEAYGGGVARSSRAPTRGGPWTWGFYRSTRWICLLSLLFPCPSPVHSVTLLHVTSIHPLKTIVWQLLFVHLVYSMLCALFFFFFFKFLSVY